MKQKTHDQRILFVLYMFILVFGASKRLYFVIVAFLEYLHLLFLIDGRETSLRISFHLSVIDVCLPLWDH